MSPVSNSTTGLTLYSDIREFQGILAQAGITCSLLPHGLLIVNTPVGRSLGQESLLSMWSQF